MPKPSINALICSVRHITVFCAQEHQRALQHYIWGIVNSKITKKYKNVALNTLHKRLCMSSETRSQHLALFDFNSSVCTGQLKYFTTLHTSMNDCKNKKCSGQGLLTYFGENREFPGGNREFHGQDFDFHYRGHGFDAQWGNWKLRSYMLYGTALKKRKRYFSESINLQMQNLQIMWINCYLFKSFRTNFVCILQIVIGQDRILLNYQFLLEGD